MKHLPKSLRPRHRYVFFEVETRPGTRIDERSLRRQIWFESQNLLGDVGSSLNDASLLEFRSEKGVGILRCQHDRVEETRAVLACIDEVDGDPMGVHVLGVSGTLKTGRQKYTGRTESEERTQVGDATAYRRGEKLDVVVEGEDPGDTNFIDATTHDTE